MDNLQRMYSSLDLVQNTTEMKSEFQFSQNLDQNYLNIMYDGDLEYAQEIFELFLLKTHEELSALQENMVTNTHSSVYQIAHRIKPTFAMVGLSEAGMIMDRIEEVAIKGKEEYNTLIKDVQHIQSRQVPLIKNELRRMQKVTLEA